ncbi:phosphatase 2C-like domain-containing protein, partial [Chytriomyces sp. MP71]
MLTENPAIDTYMSGSTAAVVIILHEDRCALIASVGDSRIILGRRDGDDVVAEQITTDHTCADDEELDRVTKNGARVEQMLTEDGKDGPLRIYKGTLPYPGLVVTRSLGDTCAIKLGVLCDPEVFERELSKRDRFFILASDGLWDGLDNGQVVKVVDKYESPQKASEVLNRKALKSLDAKAIDDNVTNVVVYL